jgi:hypothetical protein
MMRSKVKIPKCIGIRWRPKKKNTESKPIKKWRSLKLPSKKSVDDQVTLKLRKVGQRPS